MLLGFFLVTNAALTDMIENWGVVAIVPVVAITIQTFWSRASASVVIDARGGLTGGFGLAAFVGRFNSDRSLNSGRLLVGRRLQCFEPVPLIGLPHRLANMFSFFCQVAGVFPGSNR